jgi:hypothetical protein
VGQIHTLDEAPIVRDIRAFVGPLSEDEAALIRLLTPAGLSRRVTVEHLLDLIDLLMTVRSDEAMADYVYAIAPEWDGGIDALVLGGRLIGAVARYGLTRAA